MKYLHANKVVHGNLKPSNGMFLIDRFHLKLTNNGWSCTFNYELYVPYNIVLLTADWTAKVYILQFVYSLKTPDYTFISLSMAHRDTQYIYAWLHATAADKNTSFITQISDLPMAANGIKEGMASGVGVYRWTAPEVCYCSQLITHSELSKHAYMLGFASNKCTV